MNLQAKLDQTIKEYNDLHANVQAGEAQLATMKEQRQQLIGKITLLQEMLQNGEVLQNDNEQLIKTDDPTEE